MRVFVVVAVVVVVALAGFVAYHQLNSTSKAAAGPSTSRSRTGVIAPDQASTQHATPTEAPDNSACPARVQQVFEPTAITVSGVASRVTVITPPRDANGVPGVPPLTSTGKLEFAFDREQNVLPGSPHGNVLLNAHTYPDGSALGNELLAGLHDGGRIVALDGQSQKLCYRVTQRVEVDASKPFPAYYSRTGKPQLAIIVCSGRRLGAGQWEKRTIWFASPSH